MYSSFSVFSAWFFLAFSNSSLKSFRPYFFVNSRIASACSSKTSLYSPSLKGRYCLIPSRMGGYLSVSAAVLWSMSSLMEIP